MTENELLERYYRGDCLCDICKRRFMCWTSKRIFSDPVYQALYEVHIAEGLSHEKSLAAVKEILKRAVLEATIREEIRERRKEHDRPPKFVTLRKVFRQ